MLDDLVHSLARSHRETQCAIHLSDDTVKVMADDLMSKIDCSTLDITRLPDYFRFRVLYDFDKLCKEKTISDHDFREYCEAVRGRGSIWFYDAVGNLAMYPIGTVPENMQTVTNTYNRVRLLSRP
jgi:hypothetical protein